MGNGGDGLWQIDGGSMMGVGLVFAFGGHAGFVLDQLQV